MYNRLRKDVFKRMVNDGRVMIKCTYRFTDDYQFDDATNFGKTEYMKAKIESNNERHRPFKEDEEDYMPLPEYYFDMNPYCAINAEKTEGFIDIHSNLSYHFKII